MPNPRLSAEKTEFTNTLARRNNAHNGRSYKRFKNHNKGMHWVPPVALTS